MLQENVEIVRQNFERFARGNFTESADLPDDVVVVTAPEMPDAGTYRGAAAREWLTAWVNSFESLTLDPVEVLDAGGSTPVELRTWSVSTRREGVLMRFALFQSRAEALEAAGLSE